MLAPLGSLCFSRGCSGEKDYFMPPLIPVHVPGKGMKDKREMTTKGKGKERDRLHFDFSTLQGKRGGKKAKLLADQAKRDQEEQLSEGRKEERSAKGRNKVLRAMGRQSLIYNHSCPRGDKREGQTTQAACQESCQTWEETSKR